MLLAEPPAIRRQLATVIQQRDMKTEPTRRVAGVCSTWITVETDRPVGLPSVTINDYRLHCEIPFGRTVKQFPSVSQSHLSLYCSSSSIGIINFPHLLRPFVEQDACVPRPVVVSSLQDSQSRKTVLKFVLLLCLRRASAKH